MPKPTCFYNIAANVREASIDLLAHKGGWGDMDIVNTQSVLSRQCGCCSHSIAAVSREYFLICLEATVLNPQYSKNGASS